MKNKVGTYRKKAKLATMIALGVNTILGICKITVGVIFSSVSLLADGFDSVMDLFMGIFAYIGMMITQKPADDKHHYGHEKFEMIFLLLIITVIGFTGIGIFLHALDRLTRGINLEFSIIALIVIVVSIIGKIGISLIVYRTSIEIDSPSLRATSLNYFTDVFSSILVLVAFLGSYLGIGYLDSIAAFIICMIIFYSVAKMLNETLDLVVDRAPKEQDLKSILETAHSVTGVREVHKLRARSIGNKIIGDMHVLVDPEISVKQGHVISEAVSDTIQRKTGAKIIVHLEPFDLI